MKFWFGKKESAQESVAVENEVHADVKEELTSGKGGEVAASKGPEASGRLTGLAGASDSGAAGKGADGSSVPLKADSGLPAIESGAKPVEAQEVPDSRGGVAATTTGAGPAAALAPVLKALLPSDSGATRIRPAINLRPAAQGAGLAALATACKLVDRSSVASADAAKAPAEEKESGDAADGGETEAADVHKTDDEPAEKGRAVIESEVAPVRPKPDQRVLYYQLMNGLYDAILVLDEKGHVVDCNTRFTDILGYPREDSWDMPISSIIAGMTSQMLGHLKSNLAENHHIILDARCLRKDGTSFTAEVGVSVFSLTRGDNMVFMIRNVDRRKRAMDELRKGSAALEIALAPAFVCDTDGFFVIVNNAFLESFSIPDLEHAKAVRLVDLLPDAARVFLRAACGEKIRDKLQIAMPDGTGLALDVSLAPVQNGQVITGVAGSIMQI